MNTLLDQGTQPLEGEDLQWERYKHIYSHYILSIALKGF